ncbi:hypothetical protein C1645_839327 [Glomus cerebriforme]|uniref:Serine-threonine/tyrosine-protein kinase catalytic domain-containing protein n=1 Tax=Glomus cerebriforme TaxID=658196 RepID=A0A397S6X3_9GLOM|nr:hypothetical protein C1645_839327 [Glomus cerebriforme]
MLNSSYLITSDNLVPTIQLFGITQDSETSFVSGLSKLVDKPTKSNEIYGVLSYITPKVLRGEPNIEICQGLRPKIVKGTVVEYAKLTKKCWHYNHPNKRPTAEVTIFLITEFKY